jgi:hypothetical protein
MAEIYRGKTDATSSEHDTTRTGRIVAIVGVLIALAIIALLIWNNAR